MAIGSGCATSVVDATSFSVDLVASLQSENAEVKARLLRLEQAVFANGAGDAAATHTHSPASETNAQVYSADTRWLESVAARPINEQAQDSTTPSIHIATLAGIKESLLAGTNIAGVMLPTLDEALELFTAYTEHVSPLQHLLYEPDVRESIHKLYHSLSSCTPCCYSDCALILSALASLASYDPDLLGNSFGGGPLAYYWLRCSRDLLDYCTRACTSDLQMVQTNIIAMFLIYHLEGISPASRHLQAAAIVAAKNMGLHIMDAMHSRVKEVTQRQIIDAEVRRRVWWHLTATDWSLSLCGGPQEGTYSIMPAQMQVKLPRNISDQDLATQDATFERPASEVTPMTYYLKRIRLGKVCREAADLTWELSIVQQPEEVSYERITTLDAKLTGLLDNCPMTIMNAINSTDAAQAKQQMFTYLTVQARRCKLHMAFFLRAGDSSVYEPSKFACLQSAKFILLVLREALPANLAHDRSGMHCVTFQHHLFIAAIVLAMDACLHRDAFGTADSLRDLEQICELFAAVKHRAATAGSFLESLLSVLSKHGVSVPGFERQSADQTLLQAEVPQSGSMTNQDLLMTDTTFDELWQNYMDFDAQSASLNWTGMLLDVNAAEAGATRLPP
ncbi:hypothetical protein B0A48_17332 [Cryoendolithus antarcticus]|uniref:Xylanolytic transcriptional activator regulatory domain-containing protein n=1 Tax=Cryoendolithus antarcticus TaxID=1507870 RepID=A0A1V8SC34_9PEZI|nr:hypothetical protein B0A48_17332 [Cryoendolithus antarcticus]